MSSIGSLTLKSQVPAEVQKISKHKGQNYRLAKFYESFDKHKAERVAACGNNLIYGVKNGKRMLISGNFCQIRLCPLCSWRRSKKLFNNVFSIISAPEMAKYEYIFLTLTMKNVTDNELERAIAQILKAWNKLTKNEKGRGFNRSFAGTFRALEVTYNREAQTYHPHLHVLAAVPPEYFKRKTSRYYVTQKKLRDLWAGALGVDYLPQCRIQKVENAQAKYVSEVAKYTVKTLTIPNAEVLQTFDSALRRKRLTAFGGVFKSTAMSLKIADEVKAAAEDGAADMMANPEIVKEVYGWNIGARTYELKTIL